MAASGIGLRRRGFVVLAASLLVASMASRAEAGSGPLRAGAAAADITPALGVLLDGIVMKIGPVKQVHDPLFARCLVLDDGATRVALVVCDVTVITRAVSDRVKALVQKQAGLPPGRVLIAATHTHMAPRVGIGEGKLNEEYEARFAQAIADAVTGAIGNLAPAKAGWGVGRKPEFARNRRCLMAPGTAPPNPFGETGDRVVMYGYGRKGALGPAGPVDPEVGVLSVQHADGRPLAVLANYGIHYVTFKGGVASADYYGCFVTRLAELLGAKDAQPPFVGIMSNGASGNVGAVGGGFDKAREVGDRLAEEVARVCKGIEHRSPVELAVADEEIELGIRRPDAERVAWAKQTLADKSGKKPHPWTHIFAREALKLAEMPPTDHLTLQALRIGELGIAASPCETFAETGLALKAESPLKPTFLISIANGHGGYLPTPEQHKLGGYETWPASTKRLEVEAEPKIRAALLKLLRRVAPGERSGE
ncbi:MAG TPA: hypothetical protein VNE39_10270 [Planctomycetota bacterium]|nr:hypothetical protein [Planctomycetota bacterium]